jgi:hypothetical protein
MTPETELRVRRTPEDIVWHYKSHRLHRYDGETGTIKEIVKRKEHGVQLQLKARAKLVSKGMLICIPACWDETNEMDTSLSEKRSNKGYVKVDTESTDEPGTSKGSMDDTRNRAESMDDSGNGDTKDSDELLQTEMIELEIVFWKVLMAQTVQKDAHIDGRTARRLAIRARPVLLKVRAAVGRANQDLRSLVQHEKEAAQQEIQQLKQQKEEAIMEQVYKNVMEKFFKQHQAYKEEIQSLKQIITDQEASIERHKKWAKKWQRKYEQTKREREIASRAKSLITD